MVGGRRGGSRKGLGISRGGRRCQNGPSSDQGMVMAIDLAFSKRGWRLWRGIRTRQVVTPVTGDLQTEGESKRQK